MADANARDVPRTPEEPTPQDVLSLMQPCQPYTVGELSTHFDASRWTIQRRLDTLHDEGHVRRKEHAENRVSWWVPPDG